MSKQKKIQPAVKPSVQPAVKKSAAWKPYLALTVFAFILYSNTLNHFYALDDGTVLTRNQFTQQGIKGIPDIFKYDSFVGQYQNNYQGIAANQIQEKLKVVAGGRYRPLSLVTFALEVQFFGKKNIYSDGYEFIGNALISHLNNILLYLFTMCLLYLILCRLFPLSLYPPPLNSTPLNPLKGTLERCTTSYFKGARDKWYLSFPFIVSVLFLAHPIHTEVVANIKGRDEIMTLLGALGAMWFTIKYLDTNKHYNLWLSGLCLFLGLLSKENAITFLAVIPITIYYFVLPTPKSPKGDFGLCSDSPFRGLGGKSMIPLIVASALFLLIRTSIIGFTNTSEMDSDILIDPFTNATKNETLATIFYTLFLYIKLLFFPHPLTWDYYPHHIEIVNWSNPVSILSLLFYLGITLYAIKRKPPLNPPVGGKSSPYGGVRGGLSVISYSIWLYLLPLSIVSNLFFPIGAFMGERFIFISSIGFCIFIGWLIYNYLPKITKNVKKSTYLIVFVLIIILGLYSVKTIDRNKAWKDDYTLFTTDVKTSKNSTKGNLFSGIHTLQKAESEVQKRDELCDEAAQYLKRAIELHPDNADAIQELSRLYFFCYRDVAKSLHYYAMALQNNCQIKSDDIISLDRQTYELVVHVLNQACNADEICVSPNPNGILQSCNELLEVNPDFGEVYYLMGIIYGKYLNNIELSLINFEEALALDFPKTAKFYADSGIAYTISGNYEKAVQFLLKAIESGTDDYITYKNLEVSYRKLGDMDHANSYREKANEMNQKEMKND